MLSKAIRPRTSVKSVVKLRPAHSRARLFPVLSHQMLRRWGKDTALTHTEAVLIPSSFVIRLGAGQTAENHHRRLKLSLAVSERGSSGCLICQPEALH